MKRHKIKVATCEIKKGFYRNIELGKDVVLQRMEIGNQIRNMIASHIGLSGTSDTNREAVNASINLLAYDNRNVGDGIYGLKASFEWNIAEVAWQIEQNTREFKDLLEIVYDSQDPSFAGMRRLAQSAYENGSMADAMHYFLKLSQSFQNDFSVFLSLGIISLFHEDDKEKALEYFNKAIETVESQSDFYTSYTLLYKALILRNFGRIAEAEKFSKQAVDLSPDFTEALYQNAQYSALLKNKDTAVSLLKTLISVDILYCLKITNEHDFDGIKSHITKIIKEVIDPLEKGIKSKLKKLDEKLYYLNNIMSSMNKQGLDIFDNQSVKQLSDDKEELAKVVNLNSVLSTFVVDKCLSRLDANLKYDKSQLLSSCKNARKKVESEKEEATKAFKKATDASLLSPFFLYMFLSQLYAIPVGIFVKLPSNRLTEKYNMLIGGGLGIPPGIFVLEIIAFASCALIVFVPFIRFRLKRKKIHTGLQRRGQSLDKIIKMIEKE